MSLHGIPPYIQEQILQDPISFGYNSEFNDADPIEIELNFIHKMIDEGQKDMRLIVEDLEYDDDMEEPYPYSGDGCISLLSYMVLYRRYEAAKVLLESGANQCEKWTTFDTWVPGSDNEGAEALPIAIKNGDFNMVKLLLEWFPASIPQIVVDTFQGKVPYEIAKAFPRELRSSLLATAYAGDEYTDVTFEIVDLLYENGVTPPADLVYLIGGEDVPARELKKAVYHGCDVDYTNENYDYETALMHACSVGLLENAIELVRLGADVTLVSIDGRTVEDFCQEGGIAYESIFPRESYTQQAVRAYQTPSYSGRLNIASIPNFGNKTRSLDPYQRNMS